MLIVSYFVLAGSAYLAHRTYRHCRRPPLVRRFSLDFRLPDATFAGVRTMSLDIGTALKLEVTNAKDANGAAVDLTAFPTALIDVTWAVDQAALGGVTSTGPLAATYAGTAVGTVNITATGKNVAGESVSASVSVTNVVPVPVVKSFEITAA